MTELSIRGMERNRTSDSGRLKDPPPTKTNSQSLQRHFLTLLGWPDLLFHVTSSACPITVLQPEASWLEALLQVQHLPSFTIWMSCFVFLGSQETRLKPLPQELYPSETWLSPSTHPPEPYLLPMQCGDIGQIQGLAGTLFYSFSPCTPFPWEILAS